MFTTALVALDLSPAEQPIIDCLPDLQRWGISKLILCHVIEFGYNHFAGLGHEDDYHAWLEQHAVALRATGLEVEVVVRTSGQVADDILAAAAEYAVDLLVIGSRAQSRVKELFLGSVARDVMHKSQLPVLLEWVEPSADKTLERCEATCQRALQHIMLATDLSSHASAAQQAAISLATKASKIDLVTVLTPEALNAIPAWPLMVKAALADVGQQLTGKSAQLTLLTAAGKPCEKIVQLATERDCSLIIVGKHGQGWLQSKLMGSTAASLVETARRPVLMVPMPTLAQPA